MMSRWTTSGPGKVDETEAGQLVTYLVDQESSAYPTEGSPCFELMSRGIGLRLTIYAFFEE